MMIAKINWEWEADRQNLARLEELEAFCRTIPPEQFTQMMVSELKGEPGGRASGLEVGEWLPEYGRG